jgi:DNA-binding beta-propeller fold protein YncE
MRGRIVSLAVALFVAVIFMSCRAVEQSPAAESVQQAPLFNADPGWLKLPTNWVLGQGSAVAVDSHDNVWVLHRPRYVGTLYPKPAGKQAAPAVLQFDSTGNFIQGWGGPGAGYEWPDQEHGIYVDSKDNVWIGGSARPALPGPGPGNVRSDNMLLKFTNTGKFLMQIGKRDQSTGSNDTKNLYSPTDVFFYAKTNEVFVSDGYINRRVIVFDADTGAFKRMWGAFGNVPMDAPDQLKNARTPNPKPGAREADPPPPPGGRSSPVVTTTRSDGGSGAQQFSTVHALEVSNDGLVYVADRSNSRVQVFTVDGKYVTQAFINADGPGNTACGMALSPDPQQQLLYVADFGGAHIVVMDRKTLKAVYQFGDGSGTPGNFIVRGPHHIAVDSKGNLYTAEVHPGNRVQRFAFMGLGTAPQ